VTKDFGNSEKTFLFFESFKIKYALSEEEILE